jgi:hypothetical protein
MATADLGFEARRLIRGSAAATLATGAGGAPFAALVTPAAAPDLSALMLLSSLSEHTRQLQAEPRCALLFLGAAEGPNPQTAPRVTLTGLAEKVPEPEVPALKARALAHGRDFVSSEDVAALSPYIFAHRVSLAVPTASTVGIVQEALRRPIEALSRATLHR